MEKKEEQSVEKWEYFVWYNLLKMLACKCGYKSFIVLGEGGFSLASFRMPWLV